MENEITFINLAPLSMEVPLKRIVALWASPCLLKVMVTTPVDWPLELYEIWQAVMGPISCWK